MKTTRLNVRMSERRLNKLHSYAVMKDKTVTQIVEDWVDRLPNLLVLSGVETESVKNNADPLRVKE
ncbi:hypothetical protein Cylst_1491 [Cylindrospermum stagnale PCC 7417]|uniref:CopG-like ribbon-helix-helix domain-containing protein n=1 Tax=Cylindrospermum stagnale PCC 7417 TaxID=56107 RepID=K9WTR0_9NOST|nr:hypothetical protein [Cylindrospermum stagnale]AFZ23775.1 hypothetical protein Cylst_1491 [Cylindrospermum stagnale PCC 7417]